MSPARWFRIVSMATVVLPVWRSPRISSRWPRPTGIRASTTLSPVWSGTATGARARDGPPRPPAGPPPAAPHGPPRPPPPRGGGAPPPPPPGPPPPPRGRPPLERVGGAVQAPAE